MARLGIITYNHPTLRKVGKKISEVDAEIKKLISDMVETMRETDGIGLAAPQVNRSLQLLVVDMNLIDENLDYEVFINPEITWKSEETETMEEGCLSLPGINEEVTRAESVSVEYTDENGELKKIDADGLLAVVLQHEIDHLNGTLFIDHLPPLKLKLLAGKLAEIEEIGVW
jgi:peptide deformylase